MTFKERLVAGISSVESSFPLHLRDRLLPQAEITLNLLRTSRLHPQLSAAAHFHGLVDYNKTAFAPPGRIVDTLEFFPHNYQMPQLSSTNRLLMASKAITDALQNSHPEVPFASGGDDTILTLADLAAIFKLKL
jgi:hypothetical protein